jgi:hypothetical protein
MNEYLSKLPGFPVKRVEGPVEWNKEHAEEVLPIDTFL